MEAGIYTNITILEGNLASPLAIPVIPLLGTHCEDYSNMCKDICISAAYDKIFKQSKF